MRKLYSHPIFQKLDYWIDIQIDCIRLSSKIKQNMIRVFLKLYFKEFRDMLRKYINSGDYKNPEKMINIYVNVLHNVESKSTLNSIPNVFIEKYKLMEKDHLLSTYKNIENIIISNFYTDYFDKSVALLDIFMYHFVFIILSSEETLNQLNGQMERALEGTIFDE